MADSTMAAETAVERSPRPTVVAAAIVDAYTAMIGDIPDGGEDGGGAILVALAAATEADDLDAPWRSSDLESLAGVELTIKGLRKLPSDFPGGLPWYLIVDAVVNETGELVTVRAGSVSVVAQLAKAHALGLIPGLRVVPRVAERATKNGNYPQHLEVVR